MRTTPLGAVLLAAGLLLGACADGVEQVGGAAGPITASPSPSPSPSLSPSAVPPVASTAPSSPATSPPAATSKPPAGPVLGPNGFKTLKLGMSAEDATATGLIKPWRDGGTDHCTKLSSLKAGSGEHGQVYFSPSLGLEIIDAYPGVRTPEGVKIGTSHAAMLKAYPGWENAEEEDSHAEGRGYVTVPGNSKATYRILTQAGKVAEITLQYKNQDCYE
jgi:hypothetical protein